MTLEQCKTGADKNNSYSGDYMNTGKLGEKVVIKFLQDNPQILEVNDWSEIKATQSADIDCEIITRSGQVVLAEIKSDKHLGKTGNVLFEILRINHTCRPDFSANLGWSGKTPAKFIFYYAPSVRKIYKFETRSLRKAMQAYTKETRKKMRLDIVETDDIKTTINILIPISYFNGDYKVYESLDFDREYYEEETDLPF